MKIQTIPKPINYTLLWIAAILCAFLGGMLAGPFVLGTALKPQFLDNKKQVISYHAVDSIVQATYKSYLREDNKVKVDLPEEYSLIKPTDCLKGVFDSTRNTLSIEYNNMPINKWHSIIFQFGNKYAALCVNDSLNDYSFVKPYNDKSIGCMSLLFVSTRDSAQLAADRWCAFYNPKNK